MTELCIGEYIIKLSHRIFIKHIEPSKPEFNIRLHHMSRKKNRPPILMEFSDQSGKMFFFNTEEVRRYVRRNFNLDLPVTVFEGMNARMLMKEMIKS